jgi:hypothetical protein
MIFAMGLDMIAFEHRLMDVYQKHASELAIIYGVSKQRSANAIVMCDQPSPPLAFSSSESSSNFCSVDLSSFFLFVAASPPDVRYKNCRSL